MAEKNTTPELRFKGYTDAWEERRLGEISEKVKEKNISGEVTETLTNSAEFGIINQRDFFDKDISNAENLNGYSIVRNDDFVYNPRISNLAPVGPVKRNKLGKTGVMSPLYYVFRTHDIDKSYLERYFESNYWHEFMRLNGDSGARSDRFSIKDLVLTEMPIPYPSLPEQVKIGLSLSVISDHIAYHQRKYDKMMIIKKAMLEKMFPQEGEDKPKVRFQGFTDTWEQRELGNEVEFFSGLTYTPNNVVEEGGTFVLRSSNVQNSELVNADNVYVNSDAVNSNNVELGDVIVVVRNGSRTLIGKHAQIKANMNNTVIGAFMTGIRSSQSAFISALLDTQQFNIEIEKNLGATINQITTGNFKKMRFMFSCIEEQKRIGLYFYQLDNLIALYQEEIKKLKNVKKSFVGKILV